MYEFFSVQEDEYIQAIAEARVMNRPQNLPTAFKNPIPIMYRANDPILHDEAHPFCDDMSCECHNRRIAENQEAFEHCIGNPLMAGLLTVDEAQRLYHGTQV